MTADDSLLLKQTQAAKENACKAAEISKQLQNGDNSVYSKVRIFTNSSRYYVFFKPEFTC